MRSSAHAFVRCRSPFEEGRFNEGPLPTPPFLLSSTRPSLSAIQLRTNTFDLWIFAGHGAETRYLLFQASQKKADRYFNGGRFWQLTPGGVLRDGEALREGFTRIFDALGLKAEGVWAAEYTYTIYNLKRENLEVIPVFAARVPRAQPVALPEGVSEHAWLADDAVRERLVFRGLQEGLTSVQTYVSGTPTPHPALRLL